MARDTLRAEGRAQDDADRELGVDPADEGSPAASRSARPGKDRRGTLRGAETLRWLWTQLTSMRTALVLLFALALAAIPGSLLPQRPSNPVAVSDYVKANPGWAPWLDRLGFFDVFGSAWFAAIYLLLFVSLIGCIIPRISSYSSALWQPPTPAPSRLSRLPRHVAGQVASAPGAVLDAAAKHLAGRRFRVHREGVAIAAERGYSREAGNLLFHISLVVVLIGLAWASLWGYKGTAIVVEGQAFSNTLTQYDEFGSGAAFRPDQLTAFSVAVDRFTVRFETGPIQRGAARQFTAEVTVTRSATPPAAEVLEVNGPLSIDGTSVHLLGHGYAPVVTVRDGHGDIAFSGPVVFVPQDGNFRSVGVVKAPDARPERLAFEGVFLPSAVVDPVEGVVSVFPDALNPELLLNIWTGPPKPETGRPESVYVLERTGLTQLTKANGDPVRVGMAVGDSYDLPDGRGSISFDGWKRWTKLQVSTTPGSWLILLSVFTAVAGMAVSLSVKPRRLFVRAVEDGAGCRVEVAGLDRVDGRAGLPAEVQALAEACGLGATVSATAGPEGEETQ